MPVAGTLGVARLLLLFLGSARAASAVAVSTAGQTYTDAFGCKVDVLGCYWDKKWADCLYRTFPAKSSCAQPPEYQKARDLPYNLPGCYTPPADQAASVKSAPSPPPCDKATVTSESCAAACGQWGPLLPGGSLVVWATMQAGFACFCGTPEDADGVFDKGEILPMAACGDPCPGDKSSKCGGLGANLIMRVDCSSHWGTAFLLVFLAAGGSYVGCGVLYSAKARGTPLRLQSHPHWPLWQEVRGLVEDGLQYARRDGRKHSGAAQRAPLLGDGGGDDDSHSMASSSKASRRSGKSKSDKSGKTTSRNSKQSGSSSSSSGGVGGGAAPATVVVAGAGAATPTVVAASTVAGGGGRWLHVSN